LDVGVPPLAGELFVEEGLLSPLPLPFVLLPLVEAPAESFFAASLYFSLR
jgi:hypothetical protein